MGSIDWKMYIKLYKDLQLGNVNTKEKAIAHWNKFGRAEGRTYKFYEMYPDFNWRIYTSLYEDLKNNNVCTEERAINHYLDCGRYENRRYQPGTNSFDWIFYTEYYSDLKKNNVVDENTAIRHYLKFGYLENRWINMCDIFPNFDWEIYCHLYDDLKHINNPSSGIRHYLNMGIKEGRIYNFDNIFPFFDHRTYNFIHGTDFNRKNAILHYLNNKSNSIFYEASTNKYVKKLTGRTKIIYNVDMNLINHLSLFIPRNIACRMILRLLKMNCFSGIYINNNASNYVNDLIDMAKEVGLECINFPDWSPEKHYVDIDILDAFIKNKNNINIINIRYDDKMGVMRSFYSTLKHINKIVIDNVISELKVGMAISTYLRPNNINRLDSVKRSMVSLRNTDWPCNRVIYVVDDASESKDVLNFINEQQYNYKIYTRPQNGGVAKCKNTGIRLCYDDKCDFIVLADDDVFYNRTDWIYHYLFTLLNTNVPYLSTYIYDSKRIIKINDTELSITSALNGCLIFIERDIVETVGYFQSMPGKYGHEHTDYTIRIQKNNDFKYFIDVADSGKYVKTEALHGSITHEERISGAQLNVNCINYVPKYYQCVE